MTDDGRREASIPTVTWPGGATSAVAFTFDIDAETMWTSRDPRNASRPSVVSHGRYDVETGLAVVLDFLDRNGLSSTFFVPSLVAETHPDAVREVVRRGHEVAHHGYDHTSVEDFTPEQERQRIRESLETIASIAGKPPIGYRAPLYGVTDATWGILDSLGFQFSSNLMDAIHPYIHAGTGVVEVPTQWVLDDGLYFLAAYFPPNYRQPKSSRETAEIWCGEVRANAAYGALTTLTLHPQLIGRPARIGILEQVLEAAGEVGGVWFPRLDELAAHVRATAGGATPVAGLDGGLR